MVTSNYEVDPTDVVYATPMYNATTSEVRAKLLAAGVITPSTLPERFAIFGYTQSPTLDSRSGQTPSVLQGNTYYSPVSDVYLENLLAVDSNG